jgi:hypothetical protein
MIAYLFKEDGSISMSCITEAGSSPLFTLNPFDQALRQEIRPWG